MAFLFPLLLLLLRFDKIFSVSPPPVPSCRREDLRPIRDSDISGYGNYPRTSFPISNLLSSRSCTFWCLPSLVYSSVVIDVFFKEPMILEGLTTEGNSQGFVSVFGIYFPESEESLRITVPTGDGYTLFAPQPVVADHVQLYISIYITYSSSFCWHLEPIGCPLSSVDGASGPPPKDLEINVLSSSVSLPSMDYMTSPSFLSSVQPTDSTCTDTTVSLTIKQMMISTITVTKTVHESDSSPLASVFITDENTAQRIIMTRFREVFFPVIAAVFVLIIVVALISCIGTIVWKKRRRKARSATLTEVTNVNLYELEHSENNVTNVNPSLNQIRPSINILPQVISRSRPNGSSRSSHNELKVPLILEASEEDYSRPDHEENIYASLRVHQKPKSVVACDDKQYETLD